METGNFNDQPSTKVGNYGGMCVKNRLTKAAGYTLLPPPQIYTNGGSPVDNTVEFSYNGYNSVTYYAEYITRRQKVVRGYPTFTIESAKVERLKELLAKNPDKYIEIYVVDISKDFGLTEREPAIYEASLDELLKVREIGNVQFPIEDEFDYGIKKICMCFHVDQFTHFDYLTDVERSNLKKLIDEMDAAKKKDYVSAEPSSPPSYNRRLNWTRDTLSAEANLFSELEGDKVTEENTVKTEEITLIPITLILRSEIGHCFEKIALKIYETTAQKTVISSNDVAKAITFTHGAIIGGNGYYARAVVQSGVNLYTTSVDDSERKKVYFEISEVPKVMDAVISKYSKCLSNESKVQWRIYKAAKKFKVWYEKEIFPRYADTAAQVKPTEVKAKPMKEEKPKAESTPIENSVVVTSVQIQDILNRAKWFKKQGLNGQSLPMAIKLVAEDKNFNPAPILELVNFIRQELTT